MTLWLIQENLFEQLQKVTLERNKQQTLKKFFENSKPQKLPIHVAKGQLEEQTVCFNGIWHQRQYY